LKWVNTHCSDAMIYKMYPKITQLEKQSLHISDARLLIFELFEMVLSLA
jgi:hypothetical protein